MRALVPERGRQIPETDRSEAFRRICDILPQKREEPGYSVSDARSLLLMRGSAAKCRTSPETTAVLRFGFEHPSHLSSTS